MIACMCVMFERAEGRRREREREGERGRERGESVESRLPFVMPLIRDRKGKKRKMLMNAERHEV